MNFRDAIKNHVVVIDGAMGTMVQDLDLSDAAYGGPSYKMLSDILVFSRPEAIRDIHLRYFRSGSWAVETNTFGASHLRLAEYSFDGLDLAEFPKISGVTDLRKLNYDELAYHMNKQGARLAREAAEIHRAEPGFDARPLYVLGSIGPSNWVLSSTKANLRRASYQQIVNNFYGQVLGLIDGGADVLLFETQQDPLELKAAIHGAQKALAERGSDLPIMAQVTVDPYGKMQIFNTDVLSMLTTIQGIGITTFGINCSIGPDLMTKTVERLSLNSRVPLSVIPNAGLPVSENGKTLFKLTPQDLAGHLANFVDEYGVSIVGGCCGTRPDHISAIAKAVKGKVPKRREPIKHFFVSGPQNAIELESTSGLIRIGERLNVRGSAKVRQAVENDGAIDMEALEEVVNEQVRDLGISIIDVCMDSNLVDTTTALTSVIQAMTTDFAGAMCLDSFSVESLLAAIEVYPGRPIINSISLEEYAPGLDKVDALVAPTAKHDPIYIGLCTGPKGPGITAQEKFDLAKEIFEKCQTKYGIRADQLIIDVNAFPIGAESVESMNFALESLNSIPMVKGLHPDIKVSMGVGNLTNGLAKKPYMRQVLTSVFVDEGRKVGLDAAIINPNHYVPVSSLDKEDYQLALNVILKRDMDAFARLEEISEVKKGGKVEKGPAYDKLPLEASICQKIKDGFKQRTPGTAKLNDFSYDYADTIVLQVAEALKTQAPLDFVNKFLMAAMKDLGDGFGRGEVSLPHLLKSADVMKQAMGFIESYLRFTSKTELHDEIQYKGVVVLGTVYQDVHSIGKDLVKTLLENYGYRVIDLGVQTPLQSFVDAAKKYKANAVGMSALLVQTSNHMIAVAKMLQDEGLSDVDILIGGAPVNNRHAAYVSMWGQSDEGKQLANVFYCASGMDGVNTMNQLRESPQTRSQMCEDNSKQLKWHYEQAVRQSAKAEELLKTLPRREVTLAGIKREASVYAEPETLKFSMKDFRGAIDTKTLFSLNWRYGGKNSWERKGTSLELLEKQLDEWVAKSDKNGWLVPSATFAVYPCAAVGDEVVLYHPKDTSIELARIPFTVVIGAEKSDIFSAAQYFLPLSQGKPVDAIGVQISTGGLAVDAQVEAFKAAGDSESALLLQGLADRVAEDMAEYSHTHLRERLGLQKNEGTRYSPGYPGLRDILVNALLAKLLDAKTSLGISLTDAGEFYPTGTTGAVVCFHKAARYD
jgi:5-methyltetrahydrofolate--homocysteine methyltransferase